MAHKNTAGDAYIHTNDRSAAREKLARFSQLFGQQRHDGTNFLAPIIQMLVLNKLSKKAQEEDASNQAEQKKLYEEQQNRKMSERDYLEQLKHKLELDKENRADARQEAREKRQYAREIEKEKRGAHLDLAKTKAHAALSDIYNTKNKQEDALIKSIEDPNERLTYLTDPTAKERLESKDVTPFWSKIARKSLDKLGISKYAPTKTVTTVRKK
jgi:flagellar biosynthesis GTPase FlhF